MGGRGPGDDFIRFETVPFPPPAPLAFPMETPSAGMLALGPPEGA